MHAWSSREIERILRDPKIRTVYGAALVLVATSEVLGPRARSEFPRGLATWIEEEEIPFSPTALARARDGMAGVVLTPGVPFVYLAPYEARLAVYRAEAIGPWLFTYCQN